MQVKARTIFNEGQVLTFGKYKGRLVGDLITENPGYLIWVHDNHDWADIADTVLAKCYDAIPMPKFDFSFAEIMDFKRKFESKVEKTPTPEDSYAFMLLEFLAESFKLKDEIMIKLSS